MGTPKPQLDPLPVTIRQMPTSVVQNFGKPSLNSIETYPSFHSVTCLLREACFEFVAAVGPESRGYLEEAVDQDLYVGRVR